MKGASSNEGMIVLDPFMGSGSTALACINLKRHFMGIEKEDKYVRIAEERIKKLEFQSNQESFITYDKNIIDQTNFKKNKKISNTDLLSSPYEQLVIDFDSLQ